MRRSLSATLLLSAAFLLLPGCESAVNQESYDQIKVGMSYEEVKSIMGGDGVDETASGVSLSSEGAASGSTSATKLYVWKDKDRVITVNIKDGKVTDVTKFGF